MTPSFSSLLVNDGFGAFNLLIFDFNTASNDQLTIESDFANSRYIITDPNLILTTDIPSAGGDLTHTIYVPFAVVTGGGLRYQGGRSGIGFESIVRIGIDPANGRLAQHQDTLLSGNFNNFSVTAEESRIAPANGDGTFLMSGPNSTSARLLRISRSPTLTMNVALMCVRTGR